MSTATVGTTVGADSTTPSLDGSADAVLPRLPYKRKLAPRPLAHVNNPTPPRTPNLAHSARAPSPCPHSRATS
jgi:hypothetical protein